MSHLATSLSSVSIMRLQLLDLFAQMGEGRISAASFCLKSSLIGPAGSRVATRYDRLAANYLVFVQLASIRLWLRLNESAAKIGTGLSDLGEPHRLDKNCLRTVKPKKIGLSRMHLGGAFFNPAREPTNAENDLSLPAPAAQGCIIWPKAAGPSPAALTLGCAECGAEIYSLRYQVPQTPVRLALVLKLIGLRPMGLRRLRGLGTSVHSQESEPAGGKPRQPQCRREFLSAG